MTPSDWEDFARRLEDALDMRKPGGFRELFASGARFSDPANAATEDLGTVQRQTKRMFPDWRQEITSIRGGDDWAVFEWTGHATYRGEGGADAVDGTPITMRGITIIELDADRRITSWRDYLDRKEPEDQLRAAARRAASA